jgi:RNA polymerase sigma factor (sigma-70 family)
VQSHDRDQLAERFERHRSHLRRVAYRMLGSLGEADDAVQETWLRLCRADTTRVVDLRAWLTTVVARVCLDLLRSRASRREESLDARLPDPVVGPFDASNPEEQALIADGVGVALLVVLDTLTPAERLAFVLHDVFGVPFDQIAEVVQRSPAAARKLASRARSRVRQSDAGPTGDPVRQRRVVEAFLAATRSGDFDALVRTLSPEVVLHADIGPTSPAVRLSGARAVARQALLFASRAEEASIASVNGAVGLVATGAGRTVAVLSFVVIGDRIRRIDILADTERLRRIGSAAPRGS